MELCRQLVHSYSAMFYRNINVVGQFNILKFNSSRFNTFKRFSTIQSPASKNETLKQVMTFDLGEINHPKYGKATNLTGKLPFVLPQGGYQVHEILHQPERFEQIVNNYIPVAQGLWPTPEKIRRRIEDSILITACLNPPDFNLETKPEMKVQTLCWIFGLALDDFVDSRKIFDKSVTYNIFVRAFTNWQSNFNYETILQFPNLLLTKDTKAMKSLFQHVLNEMDAVRLSMKEEIFLGPAFQVYINGVWAQLLQHRMNENGIHLKNYSSELERKIMQNNILSLIELMVVCYDIRLNPNIRQNLLFKLVYHNCGEIVTLQNGILGLLKDIEKNEVIDSPILILIEDKSYNLQEAFDKVLQDLINAYADFQFCSEQLLSVYTKDKELIRFIKLLHYVVDGCLYAYSEISRYGLRNKMKLE